MFERYADAVDRIDLEILKRRLSLLSYLELDILGAINSKLWCGYNRSKIREE